MFLITTNYLLLTTYCLFCAGDTGVDFLVIPAGVRNVSMGETGVAGTDLNSVYYNPAGLSWVSEPGLTFSHNQYFQDLNFEYAACAVPFGDIGVFGCGLYYLGMSEFNGYDDNGNFTSKQSANDTIVSIEYGRYIMGDRIAGSGLSAGCGLKYISEKLSGTQASTLSGDIGCLYTFAPEKWTLNNVLSAGLSIRNIGGRLKFESEGTNMPVDVRAGLSYSMPSQRGKPVLQIEARQASGSGTELLCGAEYWLVNVFAVRCGYVLRPEEDEGSGLRAGIGIKGGSLIFDYGYARFGDLGITHRFGISVGFGSSGSGPGAAGDFARIYRRGVELYNEGRYPESIIEFHKALELDPTNRDVLDYMRRANEKIK
jgi:hypothetical protein